MTRVSPLSSLKTGHYDRMRPSYASGCECVLGGHTSHSLYIQVLVHNPPEEHHCSLTLHFANHRDNIAMSTLSEILRYGIGQQAFTTSSMGGHSDVLRSTRDSKVPGTRCPVCASQGNEVWVIPGRLCGQCGTPC
ncbi:hypothetical protein CC79DRAFT_1338705, partial [Sarocladium strictum]